MRGIMIGLSVSTAAAPGADPVAAARRAEVLGFDFVSASDHLHGRPPTYEPWTMLSWIAAATSRIRVATRVLGVPYRPPAVLATMARTFDRLAGGRLILGLVLSPKPAAPASWPLRSARVCSWAGGRRPQVAGPVTVTVADEATRRAGAGRTAGRARRC
jgi:alkanesulfonate monooxygenase SsuD/methylene tetrahydromethanopterin reductase-like flavin-dependent oxidoreductase (luciferase family)